jgi:hypothetical protein
VPATARQKERGLSFLERASLKRTLPRYEAAYRDFERFAARRKKRLRTVEQIDQAAADYLNDRYFAGDQPDVAGFLGAAIRKFRPEVVRAAAELSLEPWLPPKASGTCARRRQSSRCRGRRLV